MKTLRTVLLVALTGIFLADSVPALAQYPTTMQDRTGNWLSGSAMTVVEEPVNVQGISDPTPDPRVPVGDSLFAIALLSGLYLVWRKRKGECRR